MTVYYVNFVVEDPEEDQDNMIRAIEKKLSSPLYVPESKATTHGWCESLYIKVILTKEKIKPPARG